MFAQVWEPAVVQPKAVACSLHGLGEHSSRYAHVAVAFGKMVILPKATTCAGTGVRGSAGISPPLKISCRI